MIDDKTLKRIEERYPGGVTSAEILDLFARHDVQLSEASLRKYVQLGLLPRSRRVGRKGKHQGSQGVYPVAVVRQIVRIKELVASHYTIDQIQREFFFMRSDVELLERTLDSIFDSLSRVAKERRGEAAVDVVARDVSEARDLASELVSRLIAIETRLTSRKEVGHVVAS